MKTAETRRKPETITRYEKLLAPDAWPRFLQSAARPVTPSLRVNTLKINVEEALAKWREQYGWHAQPIPFCSAGYWINGPNVELSRTLEYLQGYYYIQGAASMLPVEMFDLAGLARPLVLDMAASPGGKTTHLASRLGDQGLIIANDSSAGRIPGLQANLNRWGTVSAAVTRLPGELFGRRYSERFDLVLLDAPCSMEGIREVGQVRPRTIFERERESLQQRQVKLISSAFQTLKPGGQLVYSTCTLAPEENEAVLDILLNRFRSAARVLPVSHLLPIPAPALTVFDERNFDAQIQNAVRLWPHLYDTAAFFAALIVKQESTAKATSPEESARPERQLSVLPANEQSTLRKGLMEAYQFDLQQMLERYGLVLVKRNLAVYAMPQALLSEFADLGFVNAGIEVGEETRDGFVPSHALVSRFEAQFTGRRVTIPEGQVRALLLGQDLPPVTGYPPRTVVLLQDPRSRFVGRARILADRTRNLLPRWIINLETQRQGSRSFGEDV